MYSTVYILSMFSPLQKGAVLYNIDELCIFLSNNRFVAEKVFFLQIRLLLLVRWPRLKRHPAIGLRTYH